MNIKSNTLGKLQKIKNGNVFDTPLIFIRELLQNAQRSKANNVQMFVDDGKFICRDDGCGCKNPENVFTLDLSSWESTDEGFGIGFWSILAIPELTKITVRSFTWECNVDVEKLFKNADLTVDRKQIEQTTGFEVILESKYFNDDNIGEIEKYVFDVSVLLPFKTSINDFRVTHKDVFDLFEPTAYCKTYENKFFRAKISVSNNYGETINVYYDKRYVCELPYASYVAGVIEIKKDKITLKEPDRTSVKRDNKFYELSDKLTQCCKDLYISFLKEFGADDESYNRSILNWLDVKDFEKFLVFDDIMIQDEKKKTTKKTVDESTETNSHTETPNVTNIPVVKSDYERQDIVTTQNFSVTRNISSFNQTPPKPIFESFRDKVKKLKKAVWCGRGEYSMYKDQIQKAQYKGLKVIISKNILYDEVLRFYNILHISDLEDAFSETFIKRDICLKTEKEENFISLLQPICKKFGLNPNTFLIANLSLESCLVVNNEVVSKTTVVNKKNMISLYAVCDGSNVFLDRTALSLNKFNIKKGPIGKGELKAIMYNVNTIAHELAHLLYKTTDNTPEHYNKEILLQKEIIELYV